MVWIKIQCDEKFLYASGGNDNWILQYAIINNKLLLKDSIKLGEKWPEKFHLQGLKLMTLKTLYVVTKENNSLYVVNFIKKLFNSLPG